MICAVLGPSGTFSEKAAHSYWSNEVLLKSANSINELFYLLEKGSISDILIPLENTLAGTIEKSMANLTRFNVSIKGEIYMPIRQYLMANEVYELGEVELLVSQSAVYAQCEPYIEKYLSGVRSEVTSSTAKAVQIVRNERKKAAAIASYEAAKLYDLHIIAADIQDPLNITRFIHVSSKEPRLIAADKASLIFFLANYPGALSEILNIFAQHSLNLTKIISRTDYKLSEGYSFYVDIDIRSKFEVFRQVLNKLQGKGLIMKYLGAYNTYSAKADFI